MNIAIRWFCSQPRAGRVVWRRAATLSCSALLAIRASEQAYDHKGGDLVIGHPYATPSLAGVRNGAAYVRGIRNQGGLPDRLTGASTSVASRVELQSNTLEGSGVLRMREVSAIGLPPHAVTSLRHGGDYHLMLVDLKQPLKDGDRFDLTLHFERAGSQTVQVWVQTARDAAGSVCCPADQA